MLKRMLLIAAASVALPAMAHAGALIDNGTIQLGVDTRGQLNISTPSNPSATGLLVTGLRDKATKLEATADGCLCEGWGVAVQGTGITGYANNSTGTANLTVDSFTSTASTATSSVHLTSGELSVVTAFAPSASAFLYQADVTITNLTGADMTGSLLYRRTMDWDIEPTAFSEFSTIQGTALATNVLHANDNGFCDSNPLAGCSQILATGDFVDSGPTDHGANFDFIFSPLKLGESRTLRIFYGSAPDEKTALNALSSVGAEVYSFGQNSRDKTGGNGQTFIFGFEGVGGVIVPPGDGGVPEPATWALMILGMGAVGGMLRNQRRRALVA